MSYTVEDEVYIHRILEATNYYSMLQISRNATESEIKSAHRKIAILIHPDKNKAPKAHEAFIALNNATAVLLDRQKRSNYDSYLSSPRGQCKQQFELSDEAINTILISAGVVVGALGLTALLKSWFGSRKQNDEEGKAR